MIINVAVKMNSKVPIPRSECQKRRGPHFVHTFCWQISCVKMDSMKATFSILMAIHGKHSLLATIFFLWEVARNLESIPKKGF